MLLVRITDLLTNEVYLVCTCGNTYQGETCPYCEPEEETQMGIDWADDPTPAWGIDLSEAEQTRAMLSWDEYYRRH